MLKKLLSACLFIGVLGVIECLKAQGVKKQHPTGVWVCNDFKFSETFVFTNDSTFYSTTPNGLIIKEFNYLIDYSQSPFWFDYSDLQVSTAPIIRKTLISFLNDSTLIMKSSADERRPKPDMKGKYVHTYHLIKHLISTKFIREASLQDLVGVWYLSFKGKHTGEQFIFKSDGTGIHNGKDQQQLLYFHYKVNFNHKPRTIDLIYDTEKTVPAYFGFYNDTTIRMEGFPNGKRPKDWTTFGYNIRLVKQHL